MSWRQIGLAAEKWCYAQSGRHKEIWSAPALIVQRSLFLKPLATRHCQDFLLSDLTIPQYLVLGPKPLTLTPAQTCNLSILIGRPGYNILDNNGYILVPPSRA